jgi:H+-transporting ATPase
VASTDRQDRTAEAAPDAAPADPALVPSEAKAARRLARCGENALAERHVSARARLVSYFWSYFWGPVRWMIEIAAALSAAAQRWTDFAIIFVMLLLDAGAGRIAGLPLGSISRKLARLAPLPVTIVP